MYDWNKDGLITESDIRTIIESGEHTLTIELQQEVNMYAVFSH